MQKRDSGWLSLYFNPFFAPKVSQIFSETESCYPGTGSEIKLSHLLRVRPGFACCHDPQDQTYPEVQPFPPENNHIDSILFRGTFLNIRLLIKLSLAGFCYTGQKFFLVARPFGLRLIGPQLFLTERYCFFRIETTDLTYSRVHWPPGW